MFAEVETCSDLMILFSEVLGNVPRVVTLKQVCFKMAVLPFIVKVFPQEITIGMDNKVVVRMILTSAFAAVFGAAYKGDFVGVVPPEHFEVFLNLSIVVVLYVSVG